MNYAKRLLALQHLSHLRALPGDSSLYTLNDDKLLERSAVRQLQLTAPAFLLVVALLSYEVAQPLDIE